MVDNFEACPFLGCIEDRASVCSYATGINVCYAEGRKRARYRSIPLPHQEAHCLTEYGGCRVYLDGLVALGNGLPSSGRPPTIVRILRKLFPPRSGRRPVAK